MWDPGVAYSGGGFKAEYFGMLAKLEEKSFWFRARNKLILWALNKYFPRLGSFMEIGCGTGFVLAGVARAYPSARLLGSEIFVNGLHYASQRIPGAIFVQMDARRIPYEDEFDVLGAFDVLEHIDNDEIVLRNMFRAVKPGGGVLISVPQHQWLWSASDEFACHERRYSSDELHEKIRGAGFEIVQSTSFVSLLLPAMMLSRYFKHEVSKYDPLDEFHIPPALNWILEFVLTVERNLILMGVRFGCGGSRFVVARRPI